MVVKTLTRGEFTLEHSHVRDNLIGVLRDHMEIQYRPARGGRTIRKLFLAPYKAADWTLDSNIMMDVTKYSDEEYEKILKEGIENLFTHPHV